MNPSELYKENIAQRQLIKEQSKELIILLAEKKDREERMKEYIDEINRLKHD
jgi:hypothetical protein